MRRRNPIGRLELAASLPAIIIDNIIVRATRNKTTSERNFARAAFSLFFFVVRRHCINIKVAACVGVSMKVYFVEFKGWLAGWLAVSLSSRFVHFLCRAAATLISRYRPSISTFYLEKE